MAPVCGVSHTATHNSTHSICTQRAPEIVAKDPRKVRAGKFAKRLAQAAAGGALHFISILGIDIWVA